MMNPKSKSHFETNYQTPKIKRGLISLSLIFLSLSFLNCAPTASNSLSNDTRANYLLTLEDKITVQNQALLNLSAANLSCSNNSDCTTIEVGRKACGGPRGYYVVSKNNDMAQIQALSLEIINLEKTYLIEQQAISTCELVEQPTPSCVSNICK